MVDGIACATDGRGILGSTDSFIWSVLGFSAASGRHCRDSSGVLIGFCLRSRKPYLCKANLSKFELTGIELTCIGSCMTNSVFYDLSELLIMDRLIL